MSPAPLRFASVVLVDRRGWILLQERDEHPTIDPERWGFVGGHVEPGESFEQAAYRELAEETGVRLDDGLLLHGVFPVFHTHSGSTDRFSLYAAATDLSDADIVVGEGRRIVFVDPATVADLPLASAPLVALAGFLGSSTYERLRG